MSKRLSLREALERRVSVQGIPRNECGSPVGLVLRIKGDEGLPRPVELVRLLVTNGASLRKAHDIVNRLANGGIVPVELANVVNAQDVLSALAELGVRGARPSEPMPVDVAALRTRQGLTQREFSIRYGFELGTLRNWEQSRNPQDHQTRMLLHVIRTHPEIIDEIIGDMGVN
ncbi:MAG: hypothetical protein HQL40_07660 [Alphaproteobacteria bacterium]|nr:hypothetical protein [Alphaproteobacteria bacterium]